MTGKVCIIVPCYNEAGRLRLDRFRDFAGRADDFYFCFVDDGSTDSTAGLLGGFKAEMGGRVDLVRLPRNVGKGEAVRAGLRHILEEGYAAAGYMDADLSTPPEEMERLCGILAGNPDISAVIGSRRRLRGANIRRKALRHYPGRIFAAVIGMLFSLGLYDTQCGAKVFRASLAGEASKDPFISRWLFDIELLLRIKRLAGAKAVLEVPLMVWVDGGDSRIKFADLFRIPKDLLKIYRRYMTRA